MAAGSSSTDGTSSWTSNLLRPALIVAIVIAVFVWINSIELDSIEKRLLATDAIVDAVLRHMLLVAVSTVTVVALALPTGVALTRRTKTARRLGPRCLLSPTSARRCRRWASWC